MKRRLYWKPNPPKSPDAKWNRLGLLSLFWVYVSIFFVAFVAGELSSITWLILAAWLNFAIAFISLIVFAGLAQRSRNKDIGDLQEKQNRIPKHYKIGYDGQIVELKKPRKRSKNPHQR